MRAAQVGGHVDGPHRLTRRSVPPADVAEVELLDPPAGSRPGTGADGDRRKPRALIVAVACGVALVALLAWPQPAPAPADSPGPREGVLAWPARGPLSEDASLLRRAGEAWDEAAAAGRVAAPGPDIQALYLGDGGGDDASVVVASTGRDGRPVVAVARQTGSRVTVLSAAPVDRTPPAIVLPAGAGVRLLLPPPPVTSDLVVRRADGLWQVLEARVDGVTAPVRGLTAEPLVLAEVTSAFGQRGLRETFRLDPGAPLPQLDDTGVTTPRWGRTLVVTPEEYDAAASVVPVVQPGSRVAVLGSTGVPGARTVLAEVTAPGTVSPSLVLAATEPGNVFTGPAPVARDAVAAGVLPRTDGRTVVLVASSPAVARVVVRDPRGRVLVEGTGSASVVVPPPAPPTLQVLGYGPDGTVVDRVAVAVAGREDETEGTGGGGAPGGRA